MVLVVQRAQPLPHVQDLLPKELDLLLVLADKLLSLLKHVLQTQRVDSEHTTFKKARYLSSTALTLVFTLLPAAEGTPVSRLYPVSFRECLCPCTTVAHTILIVFILLFIKIRIISMLCC